MNTLFNRLFPYCIKQLENGRWIFLNRHYKPIGFNADTGDIAYEDYPISYKLPGLTKQKIQKLTEKDTGDWPKEIWLYSDCSNPEKSASNMADYLKKLEILAKLKEK